MTAPRDLDLWRESASVAGLDKLFEHLPDVCFFAKDRDGRFASVNQAFVQLVRASSTEVVVGRRDVDFFSANLAESFACDDREVMNSRRALVDKVELIRRQDGGARWFSTTRLPVVNGHGVVIGVCGIMRDLRRPRNGSRSLAWAPVLAAIKAENGPLPSTRDLASQVGLSDCQFRRHFRRKFGMSPRAYMTKVRLAAARQLLVTSELPLSEVALRTGFYDQSHFSNQFSQCYGVSPSRYRARQAAGSALDLRKVSA